jgi:hypothetical protein
MGGLGCDNMTVILICLLHDAGSYDKLAEKCSSTNLSTNNNNNFDSNNLKTRTNDGDSDSIQSIGSINSDLGKHEDVVLATS